MKFISRSGFFKKGPNKDGRLDPDTVHTISEFTSLSHSDRNYKIFTDITILNMLLPVCFRELCGLCWMLHVRDQLSICCRKYQAARQQARDEQVLQPFF